MLRDLFNNYEWSLLKRQNEELCEKAVSLPEEITLYNIQPVLQHDPEREDVSHQKES